MAYVGLPVVATLKARTIVMARQDDVLHAYLKALPDPLPQGCSKESLPPDRANWRRRLGEIFGEFADFKGAANFTPPDPLKTPGTAGRVTNGYVDTAGGQVLVRRAGGGRARPLVFLPDLPGSARADLDLLLALGRDRAAYGIDLPGQCESAALVNPSPDNFVASIAGTLTALGLERIDLVAEGQSTPLAVAFAAAYPARVATLVLDGAMIAPADQRAEMRINLCPDLRPTRDGAYLHRCFHMLRDQEAQWPWYDGSTKAIRKITPRVSGQRLYTRLVDTLKQHDRYADACLAAVDVDVASLLPRIGARIVTLSTPDDPRTAATIPGATAVARPADTAARASAILAALG
jgi:pimeloyl-ACP methyl ester carboxylesterase